MAEGANTLEAYLRELRARLAGLPPADVSEIEAELRSHLRDSGVGEGATEGEVAAALARLGAADELASLYVTDHLLERAQRSRSPWRLVASLFRWAAVSMAGAMTLVGVMAGYLVAGSFLAAALMKPFAPQRVGLWRLSGDEFSLRLGLSGGPPPLGTELLGWWIVPLGLLLGGAAFMLTVSFGRWVIRSRRAPLAAPR